MGATDLAREVEAELVQCILELTARTKWFDAQLPPGRDQIVLDEFVEVEVCFGLRDADPLASGDPSAYISVRERRLAARSNRPVMYWYGLVEHVGGDRWLYEGHHRHDHPWNADDVHFQSKEKGGGLPEVERERHPEAPTHIAVAIRDLMVRYFERQP